MNTLSWFFYLASALPSLATFAEKTGVLLLILCLVYIAYYKAKDYPFQGISSGVVSFPYKATVFALCLFLVSALTPSEKTIYMIAASEMGGEVVQSQEAKELYDDLRSIIKGYLKESES